MHARWADNEANSILPEEKEIVLRRYTRYAKLKSAGSVYPITA